MRLYKLACGFSAALTFNMANAVVNEWPQQINGNDSAECKAALSLARQAFQSSHFWLWAPQEIPADFGSTLVLGPQGLDLSGGDALLADVQVFDKIPLRGKSERSIYWQIDAKTGGRLLIEETARSWRGDTYTVRLIDRLLHADNYMTLDDAERDKRFAASIDSVWRAPLVFKKNDAADQPVNLWVVYVGEAYEFSAAWKVYLPQAEQLKQVCEIQFRPAVEDAVLLLPPAVQKLARLLDRSLGSGNNEGTLHPTDTIRNNVRQAWANAALRPWAPGVPYNSRQEVDEGLRAWSAQGTDRQAMYASMRRLYPLAAQALGAHYRQRFGMSKGQATETANTVLDSVFRQHYVFHREPK